MSDKINSGPASPAGILRQLWTTLAAAKPGWYNVSYDDSLCLPLLGEEVKDSDVIHWYSPATPVKDSDIYEIVGMILTDIDSTLRVETNNGHLEITIGRIR